MVSQYIKGNELFHASVQRSLLTLVILIHLRITTGYDRHSTLCSAGQYTIICIPEDYMKFELPSTDAPTLVSIGVDIKDIPKVKDKDFSITINAYFIAKWRDVRLQINDLNDTRSRRQRVENDEVKLIPVNPEVFSKRLWLPDVGT